MLEEFE